MYKNKFIKKIVLFILLVTYMIISKNMIYAADFNASASSVSAAQGEDITVTVTFSSSVSIGAFDMKLKYDANILQYISGADGGGGGSLQFIEEHLNSSSTSRKVTFKTISSGTTNLTFETIGEAYDTDVNGMTVKSSNGSVTVSAPVSYSSDNNLAALNVAAVNEDGSTQTVSLSPAFSADVTSYNASIAATVTRLSLDAAAADAKAAVSVSGTRMDPGNNTTTITITAEDGSVKKYTIYTKKEIAEEATTEQESTTMEETTAQEETTVAEETTEETASPLDVTVNGQTYTITDVREDSITIPEGYEVVSIDYKGTSVVGLEGLSSNITLLYLINTETQEGALYLYRKDTDSFETYIPLTVRQQIYTILSIPEGQTLPYGGMIGKEYELVTIKISEKEAEGLKFGAEGIYLVYAMNYNGKEGFYYYDEKEGTMLRYQYSTLEENILNAGISDDITSMDNKERKLYESRIEKRNLLIYILIGVIVVLILVILIVTMLSQKHVMDEEEYEEDDESEDEDDEEPLDEEKIDEVLDNLLNKK